MANSDPGRHAAGLAAEHVLLAGQAVEFHGATMAPFLRDGDFISIASTPFAALRCGDIVTVRGNPKLPTGRIARLQRDQAFITADNWPDFHMTVAPDEILGKVVCRSRAGSDLSPASWIWRLHTAVALLREALRARSALTRRKRARFLAR